MYMKPIALFSMLLVVSGAVAAQPLNPISKTWRPLTAKTVNPDWIRDVCAQTVEQEQSAIKKIHVLNVSTSFKNDHVAECTVSAKVLEGPGLVVSGGAVTTTDMRYSGTMSLETGNVEFARVDEAAAKQAAMNALALALIDLKPRVVSSEKMAYTANVAGKKCEIEVSIDSSPPTKHWLVTKMDCKHKR